MGAVGSCYENAVAETFFARLAKERLLHDARRAAGGLGPSCARPSSSFEGSGDPTRLHSTLGMRSPAEYEADHVAGDADGRSRTAARAGAREKLCTTCGCAQLPRQRQPDSTKRGEVQTNDLDRARPPRTSIQHEGVDIGASSESARTEG